jgi:hypothetical protein
MTCADCEKLRDLERENAILREILKELIPDERMRLEYINRVLLRTKP